MRDVESFKQVDASSPAVGSSVEGIDASPLPFFASAPPSTKPSASSNDVEAFTEIDSFDDLDTVTGLETSGESAEGEGSVEVVEDDSEVAVEVAVKPSRSVKRAARREAKQAKKAAKRAGNEENENVNEPDVDAELVSGSDNAGLADDDVSVELRESRLQQALFSVNVLLKRGLVVLRGFVARVDDRVKLHGSRFGVADGGRNSSVWVVEDDCVHQHVFRKQHCTRIVRTEYEDSAAALTAVRKTSSSSDLIVYAGGVPSVEGFLWNNEGYELEAVESFFDEYSSHRDWGVFLTPPPESSYATSSAVAVVYENDDDLSQLGRKQVIPAGLCVPVGAPFNGNGLWVRVGTQFTEIVAVLEGVPRRFHRAVPFKAPAGVDRSKAEELNHSGSGVRYVAALLEGVARNEHDALLRVVANSVAHVVDDLDERWGISLRSRNLFLHGPGASMPHLRDSLTRLEAGGAKGIGWRVLTAPNTEPEHSQRSDDTQLGSHTTQLSTARLAHHSLRAFSPARELKVAKRTRTRRILLITAVLLTPLLIVAAAASFISNQRDTQVAEIQAEITRLTNERGVTAALATAAQREIRQYTDLQAWLGCSNNTTTNADTDTDVDNENITELNDRFNGFGGPVTASPNPVELARWRTGEADVDGDWMDDLSNKAFNELVPPSPFVVSQDSTVAASQPCLPVSFHPFRQWLWSPFLPALVAQAVGVSDLVEGSPPFSVISVTADTPEFGWSTKHAVQVELHLATTQPVFNTALEFDALYVLRPDTHNGLLRRLAPVAAFYFGEAATVEIVDVTQWRAGVRTNTNSPRTSLLLTARLAGAFAPPFERVPLGNDNE